MRDGSFNSDMPTAATSLGLGWLLELIGYTPEENLSLNRQGASGGTFRSEVLPYTDTDTVEASVQALADGNNVWHSVNPTRLRTDAEGGRGGAEDVTRLAAIWCDLDVKPGGCRDLAHAHQVIDELSALLGTRPSAVVMSGSGLHPYWPIDDGQIVTPGVTGDPHLAAAEVELRAEAAALLKRWGRLACIVADGLGAKIDRGVYDLARVLRTPLSYNLKGDPILVTIAADTGAPLSLGELTERLDEHGVAEYEGDRRTSVETISAPESWDFAVTTCEYFAPTINAWRTEPITERHPWLMRQSVRVMAALRNGCLTADEFKAAKRVIVGRFETECARGGREIPDFEIPAAFAWAAQHVGTKTDGELATEFGGHKHAWQRAQPRTVTLTPVPSAPTTDGALAVVVDLAEHRQPVSVDVTLTDTGNADLLVRVWGDRLRYCEDTGKWLTWKGTHWRTTGEAAVYEAVRSVVESMEVDKNDRDALRHKIKSLSRRGLSDATALAQRRTAMSIGLADLDDKPYELNTPTGIVNLRDGTVAAHSSREFHTKITGAGYDPEATAPNLHAFLGETFGGDDELIGYIQRLAGLAAIGRVSHHVLPFLFGGGSNGKTVILEVLAAALGDYAITAPAEFLLAGRDKHETEIARLHRARMVVCSEVNRDSRFDESKVKRLTGGDGLTGRYMRQDFFDFAPSHTLFLTGNHQPQVEAGGTSFWRRLRLIPFLHQVPPERRNPNLAAELVADEGAAILAWVVGGARQVLAAGLKEPASVMAATTEYADREDPLGRFLAEGLDTTAPDILKVKASDAYDAYRRWGNATDETVVGNVKFGRELADRGVKAARSHGVRFYVGVQIRPEWQPSPGWT